MSPSNRINIKFLFTFTLSLFSPRFNSSQFSLFYFFVFLRQAKKSLSLLSSFFCTRTFQTRKVVNLVRSLNHKFSEKEKATKKFEIVLCCCVCKEIVLILSWLSENINNATKKWVRNIPKKNILEVALQRLFSSKTTEQGKLKCWLNSWIKCSFTEMLCVYK